MKIDLLERYAQESSREYLYRIMKNNIINLNMPPGCSVSEKELGELLGVSRAPVREAFIKLSHEMLLDIIPQKGTYVSLIDVDQVDQAKFLRHCVEEEVIKLACVSFPQDDLFKLQSSLLLQELCVQEKNYIKLFELDEAMHGTIFSGCNKASIWSVIQQLNVHYNRVRMMNLAYSYDWQRIVDQHRQIVHAIQQGDVSWGERIANIHFNKVVIDMDDLQKEFPHYFKKPKYIASNDAD